MKDEDVIEWTPEMGKTFKNALCGRSPDHKDWQEYYNEGDLEGVYKCWENLAKEETGDRVFWRAIMKVIEYKKK